MPLTLAPLPTASLPEAVARIAGGPTPAKLMAARGFAPLRPAELALALYQLSFDADEQVKAAAAASPARTPDQILLMPLRDALPDVVLHWFAECLPLERSAAVEAILLNSATADETFVLMARKPLHQRAMDILFENEQRLLRCPAILETLYVNERAPMAALNRAIELCVRNGVRLDAIPAYAEIARSIGEDPSAKDPVAAGAFDAVLQVATVEQSMLEGGSTLAAGAAATPVAATAAPEIARPAQQPAPTDAGAPEGKPKRSSIIIDYGKLKLHEKIRLATLGNYGVRRNLIRDSNKLVALATVRSPRITEAEIVQAASNKALCDEVIRYISSQKHYMRLYSVKLSLINNPKCPLATSMKLVPYLRVEDLKDLAKSKGVPAALVIQAKKMVATRSKT